MKKRAAIEEEYARSMLKLAHSHIKMEGKEGSFRDSWIQFVQNHEKIAHVHLNLSNSVSELSEALSTLYKDTERSRKQLKSAGYQHAKMLTDSEHALEKQKHKYELLSQDWEHTILSREGPSKTLYPPKKLGGITRSFSMPLTLLRQPNASAAKLQKYEEDARSKVAQANSALNQQLLNTSELRRAYFNRHLPRFIRLLKEANDQCDESLKSHLFKYSQTVQDSLASELDVICPAQDIGLSSMIESMDNAKDFQEYMVHYLSHANLESGVKHDPSMDPQNLHFGKDLVELYERDKTPVPIVVSKCLNFLEMKALKIQGIYRESCGLMRMHTLQDLLDQGNSFV